MNFPPNFFARSSCNLFDSLLANKELRDEFEDTKNEIIRMLRISDSQFVFETEPYVLRKSSLK